MDRKLQQFLAVAETGNVSAAAEMLNISQPTVSVNIKRLEEAHGVPLFARSSKGVVLTDFGQVLYDHARGMDQLAKHAAARIWDMKQSARPKLRLACGFTWWDLLVRPAMRDLRRMQPDAALHVDICSSLEGIRSLMSGDITLFLGTRVQRLSQHIKLAFAPLFETSDTVFVGAQHPLARGPVTMDDLRRYPRLDVAPFGANHLGIAEHDHGSLKSLWDGFGPAQLSSNSMTAGISILQDSDAWLYYPQAAVTFLAANDIVPLKLTDPPDVRTQIGFYAMAEQSPGDLHQLATGLITDKLAPMGLRPDLSGQSASSQPK